MELNMRYQQLKEKVNERKDAFTKLMCFLEKETRLTHE